MGACDPVQVPAITATLARGVTREALRELREGIRRRYERRCQTMDPARGKHTWASMIRRETAQFRHVYADALLWDDYHDERKRSRYRAVVLRTCRIDRRDAPQIGLWAVEMARRHAGGIMEWMVPIIVSDHLLERIVLRHRTLDFAAVRRALRPVASALVGEMASGLLPAPARLMIRAPGGAVMGNVVAREGMDYILLKTFLDEAKLFDDQRALLARLPVSVSVPDPYRFARLALMPIPPDPPAVQRRACNDEIAGDDE